MENTLLVIVSVGVIGMMIFFTWKFLSPQAPVPPQVNIVERRVVEDPYRFWTNSYWRSPQVYHTGFGRRHTINSAGYRFH